MVENLRKSLRDSAAARWTALVIVSFTMMCGYFLTDIMAPLAGLLEGQLGWSRADYGTFTSSYGWFNVFLLISSEGLSSTSWECASPDWEPPG